MIQFEVTDHLGQREGRIVDGGKVFKGRLADDPPLMSFPGLDGIAPPTTGARIEALLRAVPAMVWAMALCAWLLGIVAVAVRP